MGSSRWGRSQGHVVGLGEEEEEEEEEEEDAQLLGSGGTAPTAQALVAGRAGELGLAAPGVLNAAALTARSRGPCGQGSRAGSQAGYSRPAWGRWCWGLEPAAPSRSWHRSRPAGPVWLQRLLEGSPRELTPASPQALPGPRQQRRPPKPHGTAELRVVPLCNISAWQNPAQGRSNPALQGSGSGQAPSHPCRARGRGNRHRLQRGEV